MDDKNAEKLAAKYDCEIVITNSAFVSLIFNLSVPNNDDFKLPFSIKSIKDAGEKIFVFCLVER